jgi:hypothetical protein
MAKRKLANSDTIEWDESAAGVLKADKASVPAGIIVSRDNSTATVIGQSETYYLMAGTTELNALSVDFDMPQNGRLRLSAARPGTFFVVATFNVFSDATNTQVRTRIAKNGTTIQGTGVRLTITGTPGSGRYQSGTMMAMVALAENDYLETHIANWSEAANLTVTGLRLMASRL